MDLFGNNQSVANLNSASSISGTGGTIINSSGTAATLRIGFNASQTWSGGINGANVNVVRDGGNTWTVNSGNSFVGTLTLQGGATVLQDAGTFSGTTGIVIRRAALIWDDNAGTQALSSRLPSNVPLTMHGGAFVFRGRSGTNGAAQVGAVNLASGSSLITAAPNIGTATLTMDSLTRASNSGASVVFSGGGGVGDNGRIFIGSYTNPALYLTNGIIGAWAVALGVDPIAGGGTNAEFATYDPATGIRLAGSYGVALAAGSFGTSLQNVNVRQSGNIALGAGGITVNTLTMNNAAMTLSFAAVDDVLTLKAGGLLTGLDNNAKTIGSSTVRGRITAGSGISELFIHEGANVLTIHSIITDNGSPLNVIFDSMSQTGNTPTVTLTGINTYTGVTYANGVVLNLNAAGGSAIAGNLVISGGNNNGADSAPIANSAVVLQQNNQIADTAAVTINGGAQLNLNGFDETIATLNFTNDGGSNGNNGPGVLTGTGTLTVTGNITSSNLLNANSIPVLNGFLDVSAGQTVDVSSSTVLPGQIGLALNAAMNTGSIIKTGSGVLGIGGQSSFSGATTVTAGTLAFGQNGAFIGRSQVSLAGSATLDARGLAGVVGSVIGSGKITNFNLSVPGNLVTGWDNTNGTFSGTFTSPFVAGLLNVSKIGTGTWTLTGDSLTGGTVSNVLTVNQGTVTVSGPTGRLNFRTTTLNTGGVMIIDNSAVNVANRFGTATDVANTPGQFTDASTTAANRTTNLQGGSLNVIGSSSGGLAENLGAVNIQNGYSTLTITTGAGGSNILNFRSLNAIAASTAGGTLLLRGASLGGTAGANVANFAVVASGTSPALIGGGGAINNASISIRPDIIGDITPTGSGTGFVTYVGSAGAVGGTAGNGFRLLNSSEMSTNLGAQPAGPSFAAIVNSNNVALSSLVTTTVNTTINSLVLQNKGGVFVSAAGLSVDANPVGTTYNASGTLNNFAVTSGGILSLVGNAGIKGGILTTGTTNQLIFHTVADLVVGSYISGTSTQGIVKSSTGKLVLNRGSLIGGITTVNAGTLELNSGNANTLLVSQTATTATVYDLRVNAGVLDLKGSSQMIGALSNNATANTGGVTTAVPGSGGIITNSSATEVNFYTSTSSGTAFGGTITDSGGALSFYKSGTGNLILSGTQSYKGSTNVLGGTLTLRDNGMLTTSRAINVKYATLTLDNQGLADNTARLPVAAPISLSGGGIVINARQAIDAQDIGVVSLAEGSSSITISAFGNSLSGAYALTLADLTRDAAGGGVINFIPGANLTIGGTTNTSTAGAQPQVFLTKVNGADFTQANLVNGMIGGWAVINGSEFASYKDTLGVSHLGNTGAGYAGYASGNLSTATATQNVNDGTGRTLSSNVTANSYRTGAGITNVLGGSAGSPVTLTLGSGGLLTNVNAGVIFNRGAVGSSITSGSTDLFVWVNQNTTTINTRITGNVGLVKSGPGTLVLNATANLASTTNTNVGTLRQVALASTAGLAPGMPVSGTGIAAGTTIVSVDSATQITISSDATAAGTNTLVYGLDNSAANNYTGATVVNQGLLSLASAKNGTLLIPGNLVINGGAVSFANSNTGQIAVTSNLTIRGSGTFTLPNYSSAVTNTLASLTFSGAGGNSAPTFAFGTPTALSTLNLTAQNAITVVNDNLAFTPTINTSAAALSVINLSATNPVINVSGLSPQGLVISVPLNYTGSGGQITKTGPGSLVLGGANANILTGGLRISGGSVIFNNTAASNPYGVGTITLDDGVTILAGTAPRTISNGFAVNGNFHFGGNPSGSAPTANNLTLSGTMTLSAGSHAITVGSPLVTATIIGQITGGTNLTKAGDGTLIISSASNNYGGATIVNGGLLKLGAANVIPDASELVVAGPAVLDLAGFNETLGLISGNTPTLGGIITSSGAAVTLTIGAGSTNSDSRTFAGIITNAASPLALIKTGGGTQVLTGLNSYLGKTTIQNGAVSVTSLRNLSAASGLGAPTSAANGTIDLGSTTTTGGLIYNGTGDTTNRVINLAGTTGGALLESSGGGAITFTSAFTATGAGSKVLTLQGSNTGDNNIAAAIVNNSTSNLTSIVKAGGGTWVLSGGNTYTGTTSVNQGTLVLRRATAGTLANTAVSVANGATLAVQGTYTAGSSGTAAAGASLTLAAGSNFTMSGDSVTSTFSLVQGSSFGTGLGITSSGGQITRLAFDIGTGSTNAIDKIAVTRNVAIAGGAGNQNRITINPLPGISTIAAGTYDLITTSASMSGADVNEATGSIILSNKFIMLNQSTAYSLSLSATNGVNGKVQLVVAGQGINTLFWAGGASSFWNNAANWKTDLAGNNAGSVPDNVDTVNFTITGGGNAATRDTVLGQNMFIGTLNFTSAATSSITVGGANNLTIYGSLNVNSGSAAHSISAPVLLGANQTWSVNNTAGFTVSGVIGDSGNIFGITKTGTGTLDLSGTANTYTGATTITAGVLKVSSLADGGVTSSIGASAATAGSLVLGGGTLRYSGSVNAVTNRLFTVLSSGGVVESSGSGTLTFSSAGRIDLTDLSLQGTVQNGSTVITGLSSTTNINVNDPVTGFGVPVGAYIVSKTANSITLSAAVTYDDDDGNPDTNPPAPTVSTALAFGAARTLTLAGTNTGANTFNSLLSNTNGGAALSLVKGGVGNWILGGSNTYTGPTSIQDGSLTVSSLNSVNGGTPLLTGSSLGAPTTITAGTITLGNVTTTGTLIYTGGGEQTDRVIALAGTTGGGVVAANGTGALVFTSDLSVTGVGTKTFTLAGSSADSNRFEGIISNGSGTISFVKSGSGTWVLSGDNTYTGSTSIHAGVLSVSSLNSVSGGASSSSLGAPVNSGNGTIALGNLTTTGTLRYTGAGQTTDRILNLAGSTGGGSIESSGSGALILNGNITATGVGAKTFTVGGSYVESYNRINGTISDDPTPNPTSFVKNADSSAWLLAGTNTYSGSTTVNGGVLQVGIGGVGRTGTGGTTVNSGAALVGTGLVNGTATVTNHIFNSGAILLPGDSGGTDIGQLTFNGNLSIANGAIMNFQVANRSTNDANVFAQLIGGTYDSIGGYRDLASTLATWNSASVLAGAHDSIIVNGEFTLNQAVFTIEDNGYFGSATIGDIIDIGDWTSAGGSSTFNVGTNYRAGGTGGGNLNLPTLSGGLVYDLSKFLSDGILVIITTPPEIPVKFGYYNIAGNGSWNLASNWTPGTVPDAAANVVSFNSNISSNAIVTLDGTKTAGKLFIGDQNNTHFVTLAQGSGIGSLVFDNGKFGRALLSKVLSNSGTTSVDVVSAPILLKSNLNINVNSGGAPGRMDIAGAISGSGTGLGVTVMGAGRITYSGVTANSYTGDTRVFSRGFGDATNPQLVLGKAESINGGTASFTTTNNSSLVTISGDRTAEIYPGMSIRGVASIPGGAVVSGVSYNSLLGRTEVTLSTNATASGTTTGAFGAFGSLNFSSTAGSNTLTVTGNVTNRLVTGMALGGNTNIPAGALVGAVSYNALNNTTSVTMFSNITGTVLNATGTASGIPTTYGSFATTTANSTTVTVGSTAGFYPGMPISGNPNIPNGATVVSVTSATQFVMSVAATTAGTAVTTVFGSNVSNGSVAGNLIVGNMSLGGLGSAVVALGGSNQISDTSILRFDAGNGGASTGNNGNNAYFKLMGFDETVGGISDYTASGVIENTEGEANPYDSTLTLNTSGSQSFNGFLRNRANNNGTGNLNLVIGGTGTQILSLGNISYTGSTTVRNGATLVLESTTGFGSNILNSGTLGFRTTGTFNFNKLVTGSGSGFRDGGAGTVSFGDPTQAATIVKDVMTVTVASTAGLTAGGPVSGNGIPVGATVREVLNPTQFTINVTTLNLGTTNGLTAGISVSGTGLTSGATIASVVNGTQVILADPTSLSTTAVTPTSVSALSSQSSTATVTYSGSVQRTGAGSNATVAESNILTLTSTSGLSVGMAVSGPNIRTGTVIRSISGNQVTLSAPATATTGNQFFSFGTIVSYAGGFAIADGGTTNFNVPVDIGGAGMSIIGLEALTTVNWNERVNISAGGLSLKGTGDNAINGAVLNIQSASNVTGVINIAGADVRISGANGSLTGVTAINLSGSANSSNSNNLPGLIMLNRASVVGSTLDNAQNLADRLPNSAAINMNAGRLLLLGQGDASNASAVFAETLGSLRLNGGLNYIGSIKTNAASNTLTFTNWGGRAAGSTAIFDSLNGSTETGGKIFISAGLSNTNGILGGWAVRTSSPSGTQLFEWASVSGSEVIAYNGYSVNATIGGGTGATNLKMTSGQTVAAGSSFINSINIQNTGATTLTLNSGASLTVNSGGILASRAAHVINGSGSITAGNGSGNYDLFFHTPTNQLTVNAIIANNGTNAVSLVKSGSSTLTLNPITTKATNVAVNNSVLTVTSGGTADLVIGAPVSGTGIPAGAYITAINGNSVTISAAPTIANTGVSLSYGVSNTYSGRTVLNEGVLQISRESSLGANPSSFVADQLFLNGGRLQATGSFSFDDTNRGITIGATDGLITVADGRKLTIGNTNTIDGRLGRLIFVSDASNEGVLEIAGNNNLSGGLETQGTTTTRTNTISSSFSAGETTLRLPVGLVDGLEVGAVVTGPAGFGIQSGTTIVSIDRATNTVEISKPTTATGTNINLTYSGFNAMRLTGDNTIGFIRVLGSNLDLRGNNLLTGDIYVNNGQLTLGYQGSGVNTFTGTLTVNAGTVQLASSTALGTFVTIGQEPPDAEGNDPDGPTRLSATGGYVLRLLGGNLDLNGYDTMVSFMTGGGIISNEGTGTSVLTVNADQSFNFTGSIRDGLSGAGSVSLVKNGSGVFGLTSSNGYSGGTVINGGVVNINSIDFGGFNSGIGRSSSDAANLVLNGGALRYFSANIGYTDRSFTLGVGDNAGAVIADGSRLSATVNWGTGFSSAVAYTGSGARTFTLGGSNRGDNRFALTLGDGTGGPTSLTKTGNGTWVIDSAVSREATTTSGSAVIAMYDTSRLRVGQQVSGAGIPAGATVVSINADTNVTISVNATVSGAATLAFQGNTYSGETVVLAGILAATVDGAFGAQGGAGVVIGGGTNGSTVLGNQNATLDLRNVIYSSIEQLYLSGGTLATTTGNSSWAGLVTVSANSNILVNSGATLTLNGSLAGAGAITQLGEGTLVLKGTAESTTRNSTTGAMVPSHTVQAGTLRLDYSVNNTTKLADTGTLTLGGGRLGGAVEIVAGSHVEIVSGTTIGAGANSISRAIGSSSILRMNALSPQAGGTLNLSASNIASTDTANVNGILGGWATVGGNDWATRSTTNDLGSTMITTTRLTRGQTVTGTGIPAGATISSINANGVNITLSTGATISAMSSLTFGSNITRITSANGAASAATTANSTTVNLSGTNATNGLVVGQTISGPNIPSGAVITAINSATQIVISVPATASSNNGSFSFGTNVSIFSGVTTGLLASSTAVVLGQDGLITAFSNYLDSSSANDWALPTAVNNGANMNIIGASMQASRTPNTLRFATPNASARDMTITLEGVNVLQGSAVLVTPGMGADSAVIAGPGSLSGGAGINTDLRIFQNNTAAPFEISTVIANLAPSSRAGSTISGSAIVTVSAADLAGLAPGLSVTGTGIGSGAVINSIDAVNNRITLSANSTASGATTLSFGTVTNGLSKMGAGNLILSGLNTYTGVTTLNDGVLTVRNLAVEGFASGVVLTTQNVTTTRLVSVASTNGLTYGQTVTGTGLPAVQNVSTNTIAGSNVVTVSSPTGLSNGLPVVGPGIPAGAIIQSINGNTITLNVNATATGSGVAVNYGGASITAINSGSQFTLSNGATISATHDLTYSTVSLSSGIISSTTARNSATVTVTSTAGLTPGQSISGDNIAPGTVIETIIDGTRFTMSQTATAAGTVDLTYGANVPISSGVIASTTTSAARLVLPSTIGLTIGQTVSGTGIPSGAVIIRIVDDHNVDISLPVTSTGTNNLTYGNPTALGATLVSNTSSGSAIVTVPSLQGLAVGQKVTGAGILVGTTIAAILDNNQIVLSSPALLSSASNSLVFANDASSLGASRNTASNFIINGGVFQYNGTSAISDRGFTINSDGIFDVGNAYTNLLLAGTITTPAAEEQYRVIKRGAGLLELRGTLTPNAGSYGISNLLVYDGTLRLSATFNDQFVRSDVGALTLSGGTLELVGAPDRSTSQNMVGAFTVGEGASVVKVSATANLDTTLNLQDTVSPSKVDFQKGSTLLFVENHSGSGDANITLAGLFGIDVQVVIPRATYQTSIDIRNPGVNYFAFVDSNGYGVVASDNISIGGAAAHVIEGTPSNWQAYMNVMDGALSIDSFNGTTLSDASVNTIRFFNSDISRQATFVSGSPVVSVVSTKGLAVGQVVRSEGFILPVTTTYTIIAVDSVNNTVTLSGNAQASSSTDSLYVDALNTSAITIADTLTLVGGAVLQTTHAGRHVNSITGGRLTSALNNTDGSTADLIVHNWNPQAPLTISSVIADNPTTGRKVNFIQTGDGTTVLSGSNTFTGTTYVQGGVLRLESVLSLPLASAIRLEGGVIGINYNGVFNRSLGTAASQISWVGSGGFAAYGQDRTVNIGGAGALLTWGSGGFVPDNDSLILGAQDADKTLILENEVDLVRKSRLIEVVSGRTNAVDARITGAIHSDGGSLVKGGLGTLELTNVGNDYTGGTYLAEGTLIGTASTVFGTGAMFVGVSTDTRSPDAALVVDFRPGSSAALANKLVFGSANQQGVTVLKLGPFVNEVSGNVQVDRSSGGNIIIQTGNQYSFTTFTGGMAMSGPVSGSGGITLTGGGTFKLTNSGNSYGTATGASGAAINGATVIRNAMLMVDAPGVLSGSTIELGDATFQVVDVVRATSGASLLGTDRDNVGFTANNRGALGGSFVANGNGTLAGNGDAVPGPGAFYNVGTIIDGYTFTTSDIGARILVKDEAASPERNGIYQIVQFNADGTMNLVRVSDFSTAGNMRYGTQVTVTGGTEAGKTFFMAAPDVSSVNGAGTDPVYWFEDSLTPEATIYISNAAVTSITQDIDVNSNGFGSANIYADNDVILGGKITLQNLQSGVQETRNLVIDTTAASGVVFSGVIGEAAAEDFLSVSVNPFSNGMVRFTAQNTYKGGTIVSAGTLLLANTSGSGTGSGSVSVLSGATLGGSGSISLTGGESVSIATGATLDVGLSDDTQGSQFTIGLQNGSSVSLAGTLKLDIYHNDSLTTLRESDRLVFAKTGTPVIDITGASLELHNVSASSFNVGDTWHLIDWAGILPTGYFSGLNTADGAYRSVIGDIDLTSVSRFWDISQLYTAGVIIVAVPEPGRVFLLTFGLLAWGWRRRRQK